MSAKCLPVISALALALVPIFARGQSTASSAQQLASLDPVVVTASRFEESLSDVPAFAQVISREEMVQSAVTSVSEAVNKLGNIHIRSMLGGPLGILSDIDMRGFGASARDNTLILVDGMRVSPIDSGSIMWESIPINAVERIEIIHGGGSVQFGDKAVGGVINIITRGDLSPGASASITTGSYGTLLNNGSLVTNWGATKAKIDLAADTTDGWRENSRAQQGVAKGLLSHSLGGSDRVFIEGVYSSQQYHTPGGVLGEVNTGDRRAAKFNNVGDKTITNGSRGLLGLARSFGDGWQLLAEAAYSDSGSTQMRPYYANDGRANTAGQILYDKWSYDITPRLKKIWNSRHDSVFGLDYQRAFASYKPDTGDLQTATLENKSVYAMHRYSPFPQLEVAGGARRQIQQAAAYDSYASTSTITTSEKQQSANAADLALTYRYGDAQRNKIFIRSNRSYRFANTDEYWGCDWSSGACVRKFYGILLPQSANTLEFGGGWMLNNWGSISATVFEVNTKNEIRYNDYDSSNVNAPKIHRQGLALRASLALSQHVSLQSGLVFQESKYREGTFCNTNDNWPACVNVPLAGRQVPLAPKTTANVGVIVGEKQSLSYRLNAAYSGSQYYGGGDYNSSGFSSGAVMPGYVVMDLGARYRTQSWDFDFQVRNVADKKYSNYGGFGFVDLPGGGSGYSYYYFPGDPRTLWLSARYKFK